MKSVPLVAFGIASLLSLTACGSSSPKAAPVDTGSTSESTITDVSNKATVPGANNTTVPAATTTTGPPKPLTPDCVDFIAAQAAAFPDKQRTEMGDLPAQYANLASKYDALAVAAPDTLQADFTQVSKTYQTLSTLATQAGGDIAKFGSNPAALKAIQDKTFTAAIETVTAYTDKTCPKPKK